jgi:hypothetical protein
MTEGIEEGDDVALVGYLDYKGKPSTHDMSEAKRIKNIYFNRSGLHFIFRPIEIIEI